MALKFSTIPLQSHWESLPILKYPRAI